MLQNALEFIWKDMRRTNQRYVFALLIVAGYYANATYAKKADVVNLTNLVQGAVDEIHEMRADLRAHMNRSMPYDGAGGGGNSASRMLDRHRVIQKSD
jgi:hypothetical protein